MDDVRIQGKSIPGPKMSNDIVHRKLHFALHYQSVGIKGVRVLGSNRARRPLPLKYLAEVAHQRRGLEGLKSGRAASSTTAKREMIAIR